MTRRWLSGLLIAATALTPIAAQAQDAFGEQMLAEARTAAVRATSGGIHTVDLPASNMRQTPVARTNVAPSTNAAPTNAGDAQWQRHGRGDGGNRGGGGNDGGWRGRGGGNPTASPAPAPRSNDANSNNGGGWRSRGSDGTGDGQRHPRADAPAPVNRDYGNTNGGNYGRRAEGNRYQPPVASPAPAPVNNGRYQNRDQTRTGGYRQGDNNGGYRDRGRDNDGGTWTANPRRDGGNGGFGNRVVRDGERSNGGDRYDGTRYGRDRDHDNSRYDNNRYNRRDNDGRHNDGRYGNNRNNHNWDRDWRRDNRYDWQSYRNRYSSYYQLPGYYSPYRNWNYRRLSIGFSLWPLFYSERYWINDPWQYRLPDVYGPYRWVRYYDDALLVDVETGEVVDVIDNFFW